MTKERLKALLEREPATEKWDRYDTAWQDEQTLQACLIKLGGSQEQRRSIMQTIFSPDEQQDVLKRLESRFDSATGKGMGPALMRIQLFYLTCRYGATSSVLGIKEPFLEKLQAKLKGAVLDLIKDTSYESGEKLRDCLGCLQQRKDWLNRLFTRKEVAQLTQDLQSRVKALQESIKGFELYMEGVHQRLSNFSEACPRGSWGFACGADHEDLIDERNEAKRTQQQNIARNAAIMRLEALQSALS